MVEFLPHINVVFQVEKVRALVYTVSFYHPQTPMHATFAQDTSPPHTLNAEGTGNAGGDAIPVPEAVQQ